MTLTFDVTTELEHQLLREAQRKGLDAKSFVQLSQKATRHQTVVLGALLGLAEVRGGLR